MSDSRQTSTRPRATLASVLEDPQRCYEAARSKDSRFDGWFYCAVTSTGIYCRPSCPARTPRREHMRFYPSAAAAQQAGFRACLRCRPDATPGSPEWDLRADVAARAMRLIRDGIVDREGVEGLARRLAYSTRQLHRLMTAEVGTGPLALARAQRGQTARVLLESTDLAVADVAFAAGFTSIRQCNDTLRQIFADTPPRPSIPRRAIGSDPHGSSPARRRRRSGPVDPAPPAVPTSLHAVVGALLPRAADTPRGRDLRRPVVPAEPPPAPWRRRRVAAGAMATAPRDQNCMVADLRLSDLRDLTSAVERCRRLLDLDADPVAVVEALGNDPFLGLLVRNDPGRRVAGTVDGFELAVRAVIGQQVSVAGGRTVAGKLVVAAGERLWPSAPPEDPDALRGDAAVTHLFPTPGSLVELAGRDPGAFAMPARRRDALVALAQAVDEGGVVIDSGADPQQLRTELVSIRGIGPWTAEYVAMRALRDPDAFMPTDLGVRRSAAALGLSDDPTRLAEHSRAWRPWRSYAMAHLWSLPSPPMKGRAA